MIPILFGVIGVGLLVFFFTLMKELQGSDAPDASVKPEFSFKKIDVPIPPMPLKTDEGSGLPMGVTPLSKVAAVKAEVQGFTEVLTEKLDEKCAKLEKILEEKNQILARFEADLKHERQDRNEFESLKQILQQQIEDLKMQNKKTKEEFSKVLQDNLALQSKICDLEKPSGGAGTAPVAGNVLEVKKANQPQSFDRFFNVDDKGSSLPLRDVFGNEEK